MAPPPDNDLAGTTTVSYAAMDGTRDKLNDLAAQFQNTAAEVGARHDQVVAGPGSSAGTLRWAR
jgi:ABC-type transporter Mla subunit MlaD